MLVPPISTDDCGESNHRLLSLSSLFISIVVVFLAWGALPAGRLSSQRTSDDNEHDRHDDAGSTTCRGHRHIGCPRHCREVTSSILLCRVGDCQGYERCQQQRRWWSLAKYVASVNDVITIIVDAYFLGGGGNFAAKKQVNIKRSRQHTTKGGSNALTQAFHCCYCIRGGGVITMGWLVPNLGEGGSVGILVILVEVLFFLPRR